MTPPEKVLVALDRDDAQELRDGATRYHDLLDDTHPAIEALDAALDRDPDELVEHGRQQERTKIAESLGRRPTDPPPPEIDRPLSELIRAAEARAAATERERIRSLIEARHSEREAEMLEADCKAAYKDSPSWANVRDEKAAAVDELRSLLDDVLAALDKEVDG